MLPIPGALAKLADKNQSVYLVPAFVGLGAPYWNADVRGALFGLTRATTNRELARAALEAVCYQTNDLLEAMKKDWGSSGTTILRVDGGMTASDWTMQFLADILGAPVDRPRVLETTAIGAAYLAGLQAGLLPAPAVFAKDMETRQALQPQDECSHAGKKAGRMAGGSAQVAGVSLAAALASRITPMRISSRCY